MGDVQIWEFQCGNFVTTGQLSDACRRYLHASFHEETLNNYLTLPVRDRGTVLRKQMRYPKSHIQSELVF